jgi:hypothetical protein
VGLPHGNRLIPGLTLPVHPRIGNRKREKHRDHHPTQAQIHQIAAARPGHRGSAGPGHQHAAASAATARPGMTGTCDTTPVFIGLHGMAEGPSSTIPAISPELESFDTDQNAISGAVLNDPVAYPTVYPNKWRSLLTTPSAPEPGGGCPAGRKNEVHCGLLGGPGQDRAGRLLDRPWVINKWIMDNRPEWNMIKAMVLYGDPCWVDGNDDGLARRSPAAPGACRPRITPSRCRVAPPRTRSRCSPGLCPATR